MNIGLSHFLLVSLLLFMTGLFGLAARRNPLVILMSVELLLNAVNLSFVAFSRFYSLLSGQAAAFFIMTVSAASAGVGLTLIILISRKKGLGLTFLEQPEGAGPASSESPPGGGRS